MVPTGAEIRKRRKALKMTQQELADSVGLARSYIAMIESEKAKNVSAHHMKHIGRVLGFTSQDEQPISILVNKIRADYLSNDRQVDDCLAAAESILINANDRDLDSVGELHLLKAEMYSKQKNYPEAVRNACLAEQIFRQTGNIFNACLASFELANIDLVKSNISQAFERFLLIDQKVAINKIIDSAFLPRLYLSIAICAVEVNDFDIMRTYLAKSEKLIAKAPEQKRDLLLATKYFLLGVSLNEAMSFLDAAEAFEKAYQHYESANDQMRAIRMRTNVARTYLQSGDTRKAYEVATEAYTLKKTLDGWPASLAESELLIAEIAFAEKDYAKALSFCRLVLENSALDDSRRARTHRLIAQVSLQRGDRSEFERQMHAAVSLLRGNYSLMPLLNEILFEYMELTVTTKSPSA